MDIQREIQSLYSKNHNEGINALKNLEELSSNSEELYPFINEFIEMISNEKYVVRIRGIRLICAQAKWDINNIIDKNIESILLILQDEKPTAVRQSLSAIQNIITYKPELKDIIKEHILKINVGKYSESMHGVLQKDIECILLILQ